jgi:tripartite-type tricarboxylate transporter receptor subunit TctC
MLLARRTLLATTAAALAHPTLIQPALAQPTWPTGRPIEIVVPFAPGGGMDAMARAIAPFLAARLPGARVIVSNKPGAGGQVGTEAVANAAPDGFTPASTGRHRLPRGGARRRGGAAYPLGSAILERVK